MRALAITGMVTAALMPSISAGSLMRATPPSRRMSAGTRSSAMTETAPAFSAIAACSALTTSMMTPPRNISARPRFTRAVPVLRSSAIGPVYRRLLRRPSGLPLARRRRRCRRGHVDRSADRQQLDPRPTREQLDRLPSGVDVLGGLLLRRPRPVAPHDLPVREDPRVTLTDGLALGGGVAGATPVVRELHDHVRRGDLRTGGGRERRRAVAPFPRARRGIIRVGRVVRSDKPDVQSRRRITGRRLVLPEVLEERLRRHGLAALADQVGGTPEQVVRRRAG